MSLGGRLSGKGASSGGFLYLRRADRCSIPTSHTLSANQRFSSLSVSFPLLTYTLMKLKPQHLLSLPSSIGLTEHNRMPEAAGRGTSSGRSVRSAHRLQERVVMVTKSISGCAKSFNLPDSIVRFK